MSKTYKESHTLEQRIQRVKEELQKNPNLIPLIVEKKKGCKLAALKKVKFLINPDLQFRQLKNKVMETLSLNDPKSTLFFYVGTSLINDTQSIKEVYELKKDEDGFMYITYTDAETFG
ncbi:hypothetical protein pb186bvf_011491 [Paramecium bursaria]